MPKKYKKAERHRRIVSLITANSAVQVSKLAQELGVSTQTVRRDLDELSQSGQISRTYGGGAVRPLGVEPDFIERSRHAAAERQAIADLAVSLLSEGEVLMVGAGVSTTYFARALATRSESFHIFTNNIGVATILAANPHMKVVMAPGNVDHMEGCVHGPETLAFFDKFLADTAVYGASGLFEGGACEAHSDIAWVDRVMLKQARRNILLVDHSKFDRPYTESVCPMENIDIVVSDRVPDVELMNAIERNNVQLVVPNEIPEPAFLT